MKINQETEKYINLSFYLDYEGEEAKYLDIQEVCKILGYRIVTRDRNILKCEDNTYQYVSGALIQLTNNLGKPYNADPNARKQLEQWLEDNQGQGNKIVSNVRVELSSSTESIKQLIQTLDSFVQEFEYRITDIVKVVDPTTFEDKTIAEVKFKKDSDLMLFKLKYGSTYVKEEDL